MSDKPNPNQPAANEHETAPEQKPLSPRKALVGVALILIVLACLAGFGILHRISADKVLADTTRELAAPTVIVAAPKPGAPVDNFVLPGNVTAWTDSPIYARTSGYLTKWYFDIGARVKKGALLAEIATPEVDQQLAQAEADVNTAQANANNARIQADRYTGLVQSNAVSRQDTDTFVNQATSTAAQVRSAQANVQRLHDLQSFEKVYAPFDGVITARNVDTGQLIDPGAGKELFHLQAIQTLRVFTNLPQIYSANVKRGAKIDSLVQVGHACVVGEDNIICAQTGLAGSTVLERNVLLAGQVGSSGHLTVHEGATVYAQSGIGGDVAAGQRISGSPAFAAGEWLRAVTAFPRLPELLKTVRKLEKKIEELEQNAKSHTTSD